MSNELGEQLRKAIHGTYEGLSARVREFAYEWREEDLTVSGTFLYPPLDANGLCTIAELAEYIYWRIVPFCIPKRERKELEAKFEKTNDYRYLHELLDRAKTLFVRAKQSQKTSGEPGELLLFTLLEGLMHAPQIACKMYLKTNTNVHVHGADSIHATVGERSTNLRLIWGESKIKQKLSNAFDAVCASLLEFLKVENGQSQKDREIDIIKAYLNVTDDALRTSLLEYLDPYSEHSNEREEMYACFVTYDATKLFSKLDLLPADERENELQKRYTSVIIEVCQQFGQKLRDSGLHNRRIHLFLLPVPSVAELRCAFFQRLGVRDD